MRIEEVRQLLAEERLHPAPDEARIEPLTGGWASHTYLLDGRLVLRIARTEEIAATHRREGRLLPALAGALSFAVPEPERVSTWRGHTYMTYRHLLGRPLSRDDDPSPLAGMLRELHGFPLPQAAELLQDPATGHQEHWRSEYLRFREETDPLLAELLDPSVLAAHHHAYDQFLATATDFEPALVHRDLGPEHVLVDPDTGRPTALIDFETAAIGDPAIDFIGLFIDFGEEATRRLIADYGRPVTWSNLLFYWRIGSVHAITYGIEQNDQEIIQDGIKGLTERLAGVPGNPLQPMPHGYTNRTLGSVEEIRKTYRGPDAAQRARRERAVLAALAGRIPVPPLLGDVPSDSPPDGPPDADEALRTVRVSGVPGQQAIADGRAAAVLRACGEVLRRIHALDPAELGPLPLDGAGPVLLHSDFGPMNMLIDSASETVEAVVDWEFARLGEAVEDLAFCEWIVREHHPESVGLLPEFWNAYGREAVPSWPLRQAAMLQRFRELREFAVRWDPKAERVGTWTERITAVQDWTEISPAG